MKDKEIHWLLHSLNHHLHYLDEADKAYPQIKDMNNEIQMWRKRYAEDQLYSELETNILLSLPTEYFTNTTLLDIYKDFIKDK